MIRIVTAGSDELEAIVPLFDAYRVFYGRPSDLSAARTFISERLANRDSTIFLALLIEKPVGFTQLYPGLSSVSMAPRHLLNDLFTASEYRGKGVGKKLLQRAQRFCRDEGICGLALETAVDNKAQKLYEQMGWKRDVHCFHYFWTP